MIQEHIDEIDNQFKNSRQNLAAHCGYALAENHYKEMLDKMAETVKWYADSGNYLAATNYPEGENSDTMLATAYAKKRIENKAKKSLSDYEQFKNKQ